MRKISVVTGSRADYGLLRWLMAEIDADPALDLQTAATGMHFSPDHGLTYRAIEEDGFRIDAKVEVPLGSDSATAIAKAVGQGVIGFADAFERLAPDLVVLLGDRFEILAAAQAAALTHRPIAHLHGGEVTEGAIDESLRHAITKLSHLHFVATESFRRRVIQLGEPAGRVHRVGAPGLDALTHLTLLDDKALEAALDFSLDGRCLLVTFHPETLARGDTAADFRALLSVLEAKSDLRIVFTKPNADEGNRAIAASIDDWVADHPARAKAFDSLGQLRYLSLLRRADAVVGNSSSALIEAPALGTPSVNIGARQKGRPTAASVVTCGTTPAEIGAAIDRVLEPGFAEGLREQAPPYGGPGASARIKGLLKAVSLEGLLHKPFCDQPLGGEVPA